MIKNICNVDWQSLDDSVSIKVNIIQHEGVRYIQDVGHVFTITTQCKVEKNGLIIGLGTVTKHFKDKHNVKVAATEACRKAFANIKFKTIRKELYTKIFKAIDENK